MRQPEKTDALMVMTGGRPDWPNETTRYACLCLADLDSEYFERALYLADQETLETAAKVLAGQGETIRAWEIEREIEARRVILRRAPQEGEAA